MLEELNFNLAVVPEQHEYTEVISCQNIFHFKCMNNAGVLVEYYIICGAVQNEHVSSTTVCTRTSRRRRHILGNQESGCR